MTTRNRQLHLSGFNEFDQMTRKIAPKQARNLARSTTQGVAVEVAKRMRGNAPKKDGVLRKAIKARRRRMRGNTAISDVRIEHGKTAKYDAWYWHFVEFGTQGSDKRSFSVPENPYIRPTISDVDPEVPSIWRQKFGRGLERTLNRIAKQKGKK